MSAYSESFDFKEFVELLLEFVVASHVSLIPQPSKLIQKQLNQPSRQHGLLCAVLL